MLVTLVLQKILLLFAIVWLKSRPPQPCRRAQQLQMITNFLWPELEDMNVDDMWFQQDGATCHTANETMALLREKFNGRVISQRGDVDWPPRSCDLTPLDFFLWGYLKKKVYVDKPATIQELKDEIIRHINGIEPQLCLSVIENLEHRM